MATFLIAYDLITPGQKYQCVYDKLEAYGTYCRIQDSVWIIHSYGNASDVKANLRECLDDNDLIFVVEIATGADWSAWQKQSVLDWLGHQI